MRVRSPSVVAWLLVMAVAGCGRAHPSATSAAVSSPSRGAAAPVAASPPAGPAAAARPIRLERIGSEHGLSHNSVYAILQDARGFIWFGTQDGLDRFDGQSFVSDKHDAGDPRSLASSWISALLEDRAGRLWVGTRAGLHRRLIDGRGFERIALRLPEEREDSPPTITTLAESPDGSLWAGTDRGLFRLGAGRDRVETFRHRPGDAASLAGNLVHAVRIAPDGTPWVLTDGPGDQSTLSRFVGGLERMATVNTRALTFTSTGDLWIDPAAAIAPAAIHAYQRAPAASRPTALLADSRQGLWVGKFDGLFHRALDEEPLRLVATADLGAGALAGEINTIVEDRAGAIWIGTFGGVLRYDPQAKPFAHLAHRPGDPQSLSSNAVSSVFEDGRRLWVATYGAGLNAVDRPSGAVTHYRSRAGDPISLCGDYIWDIAPSTNGGLWVSTTDAFCRFAGGRFHPYGLVAPTISALALREDVRGRLWLGTGRGLYLFDPAVEAAVLVAGPDAGVPQPVDVLHLDAAGRVWLASGGSGDLASYDPETGRVAAFRRVALEGIWDIEASRDGLMWLATGSGLTRFDPRNGQSERISGEDHEAGSVYYSLLTDSDGRLWAGTNKGLVRVDPSTRSFRRFDLGDGIGNLEFNRHAAFAGARELFFGGMNGVTSFAPSEIRENAYLPPVVVTAIQVLGENGERSVDPQQEQELTLSPSDYAVSFEFAALNFTQSQKNRFAHKLEPFDADWIQAGTRRFARYTNLPPGQYELKVRGTNNDGVASPLEASLRVTVRPAVWETVWFRIVVVGMAIGGLFIAYKLRIRRLLELERLRLRIASDLHDELGSELSGIALASRLIGRHEQLTERDRSRLDDVASAAARITAGLRDVVWYISPEQDTLESLEQRMRSVARTMLDGIAHEFHSSGMRPVPLDMDRRRHLLLIYKELLHNVLRHAHATRVAIALEADHGVLRLEVVDNGVGLSRGTADGTGLKNIRRRAAELGAALAVESGPGRGTRTSLTMSMTRSRRSRHTVDA